MLDVDSYVNKRVRLRSKWFSAKIVIILRETCRSLVCRQSVSEKVRVVPIVIVIRLNGPEDTKGVVLCVIHVAELKMNGSLRIYGCFISVLPAHQGKLVVWGGNSTVEHEVN